MKYTLLGFFIFGLFSFPLPSYAQNQADILAQIAELQKLVLQLQAQLSSVTTYTESGVSNTSSDWEFKRPYNTILITERSEDSDAVLDDWDDLTIFTVSDGKLKTTDDGSYIEDDVWNLFVEIAGEDFVSEEILEYMTYDLPHESTLAFVEYFERTDAPWYIYKLVSGLDNGGSGYAKHPTGWGLAVNIGKTDFNDEDSLRDQVVTLIHEYAHILTLSDDQIRRDPPLLDQRCKSRGRYYLEGNAEGCAEVDSYLQAFVIEFWSDKNAKNGSNFVTKYAGTNPQEDIAESFTNFVLQQRPPVLEDVGDQKIEFFYNYPELVTLRNRIRSAIEHYFN